MYQIIENPKMMTSDDIDNTFMGKWVFIINANITRHGELIEGIPVVIGDYQFEGIEEGIYEKYKTSEYDKTLSYSLLSLDNTIVSVYGVQFV
ncbi:MAG: hypothetical protein FWD38_09465 [Oscillospiraceae bacterium]|nr:hypothetical protein [Oscillospiraceae bacterium]